MADAQAAVPSPANSGAGDSGATAIIVTTFL
jgi:hypothetical protein